MKKILLSMAVAIVALSANAATPVKKLNLNKSFKVPAELINGATSIKLDGKAAARKAPKKAEGDLYGAYLNKYDGEACPEFVGAEPETLLVANHPMTITYQDQSGAEQQQEITCNVVAPDFFGCEAKYVFGALKAYGLVEYDESVGANVLWFPDAEPVGRWDAQGYDLYFYGATPAEEEGSVYLKALTYTQDENGNWVCDTPIVTVIAVNAQGQSGLIGLNFNNSSLIGTNGVCNYVGAKGGRHEISDVVAIDDFEAQVSVYGISFDVAGTKLDFNVDEDCTVHCPTGQVLYDNDYSNDEFEYGFIHLYGDAIEGNSIMADASITELVGKIEGNTMSFPDVYFAALSNFDAEGSGYGFSHYTDLTIILDNDEFAAWKTLGIKDVKGTKEDQIRNAKSYNLMGQRVFGGKAKGLLVRDGKKYIAK